MRRRELLGLLGLSLVVPGLGGRNAHAGRGAPGSAAAFAGSNPVGTSATRPGGAGPRLVLVELAGANDGLNTLVPRGNDHYRRLRPTIGIDDAELLALDDAHGLHPALEPLMAAHAAGELAFVHGLGYPAPNRSHFRSIALWERAGDGVSRMRASGWLTHAVEHGLGARRGDVDGMSLAGGLSLFASESGRWLSAESVAQLLVRAPSGPTAVLVDNANVSRMAERVTALDTTLARLRDRLERAPDAAPLDGGELGEQLRHVTRLVAAGLDVPVFRVRLDGFDTHEHQPRRHAERLERLATALDAFRRRMIALGEWRDTVLMTYSEFGRRATENASGGTDHGTAAPHLVLGGRVAGGLYGDAPDLAPEALVDGDPVHTMDYRALYERVLDGALGAGDAHLAAYRDERLRTLFG